ncbi:MAG: hypothetical protein V3U78_01980 [Thiotrichaceae bacterium]
MKIRQLFLSIILTTAFFVPSAHADPWSAIAHFAGGLAGDVVKSYFKPKLKISEADILQKRIDILEHRYKKYDMSKGKPYNYKEIGDLIISLNNMTQAMNNRVDALDGKYTALEQRVAALEKQRSLALKVQSATAPKVTTPNNSYYVPAPSSTKVVTNNSQPHAETSGNNEKVVDCSTTSVVQELMDCYSPQASAADLYLEKAYHSLIK